MADSPAPDAATPTAATPTAATPTAATPPGATPTAATPTSTTPQATPTAATPPVPRDDPAARTLAALRDCVRNERWLCGRLVARLAPFTQRDRDTTAALLALFLVVWCVTPAGRFLANSLLLLYPLVILAKFPDELPEDMTKLGIYGLLFAITTYHDTNLDGVPGYYVYKVVLHCLIFLQPYDNVQTDASFISPTVSPSARSPLSPATK